MQLEEHPEMEGLAKKKNFEVTDILQPRDKAAMLGVNTIALFLEEFT